MKEPLCMIQVLGACLSRTFKCICQLLGEFSHLFFFLSCNVFSLCTLLCKHCMLQKILRMSVLRMTFFIVLNHFVKLHYTYQIKDNTYYIDWKKVRAVYFNHCEVNRYDLTDSLVLLLLLYLAPSRNIYLHSLCTMGYKLLRKRFIYLNNKYIP